MAATRKLDQSELMIRAGAQGESAVQRSQESRTRNRQQTLARKESARQFNRSIEQQELDRSQRQWEVTRRQRAERDATRAKNQADKRDMTIFGGLGRQQRADEAQWREAQVTDREKFEETKRQFDASQGLEAAKAGLQAKDGGAGMAAPKDPTPSGKPMAEPRDIAQVPTAEPTTAPGGVAKEEYITVGGEPDRTGAQASLDPRMQQLQQEMDQRGQVQMGQPLEVGTMASKWIADPSTPAARTATAKAQSAELQVIRERRALGLKVQEAQAKVNMAATKEAKALLKETEDKLQARVASFSDRYIKFDLSQTIGADQPSKADWAKVAELAEGKDFLPPEIHKAIADTKANPRFVAWLDEKRARMAIEYVAAGNGELPDREHYDFLTEGIKEFFNEVQVAREEMKYKFGGPVGLFSTATRAKQRRIVYKMAAAAILSKTTMTQGPGGEPAGGETPATPGGEVAGAEGMPDPGLRRGVNQQSMAEFAGTNRGATLGPDDPTMEPGEVQVTR